VTQHSHDQPAAVVVPVTPASNASSSSTLSVTQIAKQSLPGVVEVDATGTSSQSPVPGGSSSTSAEGTGWVYDTQGHIVTNEHVIDGASAVSVKFSDGSTVKATVVAKDISSDIAVLKVDVPASKLKVLPVGDSGALQIGDGVVAIGNPYGLDGSVTTGVVSALDREISAPDGTPIEGAIQTDAAINHGNSGGPLLNLDGQVVGITSQIQSDSGVNDGVGFAIPSNTVTSVVQQLLTTGKVAHPLLGVRVGTAANGGASVTSVESGSGAAKGGVKAGDVITAVNGKAVTTPEQLRAIIAAYKPGDTLKLEVRRSGSTQTLTVTLGARSA
jgi:putative serine protease PepD